LSKNAQNFTKLNLKDYTDEIMEEKTQMWQNEQQLHKQLGAKSKQVGHKRPHQQHRQISSTIYKPFEFDSQLISQTIENYFLLQ